jgi:hypothetical protein
VVTIPARAVRVALIRGHAGAQCGRAWHAGLHGTALAGPLLNGQQEPICGRGMGNQSTRVRSHAQAYLLLASCFPPRRFPDRTNAKVRRTCGRSRSARGRSAPSGTHRNQVCRARHRRRDKPACRRCHWQNTCFH